MKKFSIIGVLALLFFGFTSTGCNKDSLKNCEEHVKTPCNEEANKTNIRILNASKFDMCNVVVNPSEGDSNYGNIEAGGTSCYHTFNTAYSYAFITLEIGDQTFTFLPGDYLGEAKLGTGKFTYTIDVLDFNSGTITVKAS